MKEEVAIVAAERKWVFDENNNLTDRVIGKAAFRNPVNFDREPEYLAIFIKGESTVRVVAEIDCKKSDLRHGKIWMKNAVLVDIPLRFGKDKLEGIRYSTFRKLVTHKTTRFLK